MVNDGGMHKTPLYEVNADELYRRASAEDDYSAKAFMADAVATLGGVILLLTSGMELLNGFSAIANDEQYAEGSDYLYRFDMQVWGAVHVVIAVVSAAVAIGIIARKSWAQIAGIVVAGLAAVGNFAFIPLYPVWSLVVVALNILVIWALLTQMGRRT